MSWIVELAEEFALEFAALDAAVQTELLARARLLERFGPTLGRPHVDTLKGTRHANIKELRFDAGDGVWRVAFAFAFAFDPRRRGTLLVARDKSGVSQRMFYRRLARTADERFDSHIERLRRSKSGK
jgi:hypothetical protein